MPAWVDSAIPEQRIVEAATLLPRGGAVTGWASCRWWGGSFFDGRRADGATLIPVPLCLGPGLHLRPRREVQFLRDRLDESEVAIRHGLACTTVHRGLFDAMRLAPDIREAVVAMDMMAAALLTSPARMQAYVSTRAGWPVVRRVRAALALSSRRSRSPNETRLRLIWELDAGLPRPLVNQPVWDRHGRLLGIADLLDVQAGVVGEFDGADHRGAARHSKDVEREQGFRDEGLEFFRVTGPDIRVRRRVIRRMLSARGRARWTIERDRTWTTAPAPGAGQEQTLDEYLDERDWWRSVDQQLG
ncbi:hypothetical protein BH24ACT11_BH24ACT11_14940 [soil metagenome]